MNKMPLFLAILSFSLYGAENKKSQNIEILIEEAINADKPITPASPFSTTAFKKENDSLATKAKLIINEYQKLEKQIAPGKRLLLLRYRYTHALTEIAFYTQALLDLLEQNLRRDGDEKLGTTRDSLEIRRVKLANDYDLFNEKSNPSNQQISVGLKEVNDLFNDTKSHIETIQALINKYLTDK